MTWKMPSPQDIWKAIDIYLQAAYPGLPPSAVRNRMDTLRSVSPDDFYNSAVFERDSTASPSRFCLRLGNRCYPHMKLTIERAPDGQTHLFRADTHDRHIRPDPGSREYAAFCQLMEMNQSIAQDIEKTWEAEGLPTFKSYLRQDLARRKAEG